MKSGYPLHQANKTGMLKNIFFLFILLYPQLLLAQASPLFRIIHDDKVGYIDEKGNIVIQPVFLGGNDFSDGLAAVRQNGLYGFIDQTGKFVIEPAYDYATFFLKGIAGAYKDGALILINKKGEIAMPQVYNMLACIDDRRAFVGTYTRKQGVIDIHTKKLIIDTVFSYISSFHNGIAIVNDYISPDSKQEQKRFALIDTSGKFIIPFGQYKTIRPFVSGLAIVLFDTREDEGDETEGVIDTNGRLVFKRQKQNHSYIYGGFCDGYAKISLYKYWIPDAKGVLYDSNKGYEGYINLSGEVVFNDTNYTRVTDFSCGRAFIRKKNTDYILINKTFKRVGDGYFLDADDSRFQNGYAIVQTDDGYGIIDTMSNFVVPPRYDKIERVGISDDYFFFSTNKTGDNLYGILDIKGNIIFAPAISEYDKNGYANGLLKCIIRNKLAYLNTKGEIVWQQAEVQTSVLKPMNIDYMNRGYFRAYSSPQNTEADHSGGWATSSNRPQKIASNQLPRNTLAATIDTTKITAFATRYMGYKLFISNTTANAVSFNAQDSRLYLKLQAQDKKGVWRDIEYLPSSWCGNSYHTITLEPGAFWSFTIPKYEGMLQTKIRAELKIRDKNNPQKEKTVYSNIIKGSINPAQFWNKKIYTPTGIMDPYFD